MDLKSALEQAREGGKIACGIMMKYYRDDYATYTKQGARGRAEAVLTEPDLLCDRALQEFFSSRFPESAVISEESYTATNNGWQKKEWVWFIDPIDGSLSYLEGTDNFGVSIGLAHRGRPVLGVLNNPALGLEAWAAEGIGAFLNGKEVGFDLPAGDPPVLILSEGQKKSPNYGPARDELKPGKTLYHRSVVTKALYLLAHKADYYFSLPYEVFRGGQPNYWDIAGAAAIMQIAGGTSTDAYGDQIEFHGPDVKWKRGYVFAHPHATDVFAQQLLDYIAARERANHIDSKPADVK